MSMDPSKFDQDIGKMIIEMETLKTRIEAESKKEYDDFMLHLFTACCKSTNSSFNRFANDLKSDRETDKVGSPSTKAEVINLLNAKWNNECNPKEAKYLALISALTSNVQALSQKVQSMQKGNSSGGNLSGDKIRTHDIAEWRKTKNLGDEVTKDGKTYFWCQQHAEGNGLYVTHHPLDHGKHPKEWEHTRKIKKTSTGGSNPGASSSKLELNDTMKAALTSSGLSESKANSIIESLQGNDGADFW